MTFDKNTLLRIINEPHLEYVMDPKSRRAIALCKQCVEESQGSFLPAWCYEHACAHNLHGDPFYYSLPQPREIMPLPAKVLSSAPMKKKRGRKPKQIPVMATIISAEDIKMEAQSQFQQPLQEPYLPPRELQDHYNSIENAYDDDIVLQRKRAKIAADAEAAYQLAKRYCSSLPPPLPPLPPVQPLPPLSPLDMPSPSDLLDFELEFADLPPLPRELEMSLHSAASILEEGGGGLHLALLS